MKKTLFAVAILVALAPVARAEVVRVEIARRADVGTSGYEKLVGTIYFAVDPANPRNSVVVDLDKASKNGQGRVEFSADLYILQPKDASRRNGSRWSKCRTAAARDCCLDSRERQPAAIRRQRIIWVMAF